MKNLILSSLFASIFCFTFLSTAQAQDSIEPTHISIELDDEGPVKSLIITESETDKTYRMSCRFSKRNTKQIRKYLSGLLGEADHETANGKQEWNHLPDGAIIDDLEIVLKDGHFIIKAKDGCCPGDMAELKAIGEDVIGMIQ